jgi:hypothetical protein
LLPAPSRIHHRNRTLTPRMNHINTRRFLRGFGGCAGGCCGYCTPPTLALWGHGWFLWR